MPVSRVGAWAGHGILGADRDKYLHLVQDIGLTDICLVINDNTAREDWHLYAPEARIAQTCELARKAGAVPHLMSWAVATRDHTRAAAKALPPLARLCGVESIMLDAEEPWINHHGEGPSHHQLLADQYGDMDLGAVQLGVTAIVFTTWKAVRPLTEVADYVVPQAYSSSDRPTVMQLGHEAYASCGAGRLDMGLKGYDQNTVSLPAGRKATEALADPSIDRVWYWSLCQIGQSKVTQAFLKSWCQEVHRA